MRAARYMGPAVAGLVIALSSGPAAARDNAPFPRHQYARVIFAMQGASRNAAPMRLLPAACPPGLAKKSPACIPPGQARKMGGMVGRVVDLGAIHIVRQPGRYGLGEAPAGATYAIIDNQLVRVSTSTGKILSVIRMVDAIRD